MNCFASTMLFSTASIRDAMRCIDESALQITLVVDAENHLLGTVTDGDIRRGIIHGISLEEPVSRVMNASPKVARETETKKTLLRRMEEYGLHRLVLVDIQNRVTGLVRLEDLVKVETLENLVFIMAGGVGSRLYPLTENCPKPLLKVGKKPILETIIESFVTYGFRNFYLSVNYKAEMIEEYFKDGSLWDVKIQYIYEDKPLKTAGALSLLPERPETDLIVINGDVLTKLDFSELLHFHSSNSAEATMCVREHRVSVPFGVIETENSQITCITEKPAYDFLVNAGIYVLSPHVLDLLKKGEPLDMPDLFKRLNANKQKTVAYPLSDYWIDVGSHADFKRAQTEFEGDCHD